MGRRGVAAFVLFCILTMPAHVPAGGSDAPPQATGRSAPPPSGDWQVSGDTVIESDLRFAGNVTVLSLSTLTITSGATLTVRGEGAARLRFRVMVGASVTISDRSSLLADIYDSEPGSELKVKGLSRLMVRNSINATVGIPEVIDSEISVASGEDENASLGLNCSSWGNFSRSNISVVAGDGADGPPGRDGGTGGSASLFLVGAQLSGCDLRVVAGSGGSGGDAPDNSSGAGAGGAGGSASARLELSFISDCNLYLRAGWGGAGGLGWNGPAPGKRDGGGGGRGGDGSLDWSGGNLLLSGTDVSVLAGGGGRAAAGGDASPGTPDGGDGGDGGRGGNASTMIAGTGTFTFVDSQLETAGGAGGAGGHFGVASDDGMDGAAGSGGAGGEAVCLAGFRNQFTGSNSQLAGQGGEGGAGGNGPLAAPGGPGGNSSVSLSVETSTALASASLDRFQLGSRGGKGGEGGSPFTRGNQAGVPGRGGPGGGAALRLEAEGSIEARRSSLACEPGQGGGSSDKNLEGAPGRPSQHLSTERGDLSNCSVSHTIGPVASEHIWTLENTHVLAGEHFDISERGLAYEYWTKRVTVSDAGGTAIMDGSVTVEVWRNRTLVESRKSNSRGEAEFTLLDTLHSASGAQYRSYVLSAWDTRGRTSPNLTVFWSPDLFIDLVLLSKLEPPLCYFIGPAPGSNAVIDAGEHAGPNGTGRPYFITGRALDGPRNDEPQIQGVQLRFGEAGEWEEVPFSPEGSGVYWNYSWDILPWARRALSLYPLGIIPLTVYARAFNGFTWSDGPGAGGSVTSVNLTVRLLELPGPPPVIEMTSPARSSAQLTAAAEVESGAQVRFDARVAFSNGRNVTRWVWCFDDTGGFREDCSTAGPPLASFEYPPDREGEYLYVVLRVYDDESARRVQLLHAGVAYEEFGYDFDRQDGSISVQLKVFVRAPRPAGTEAAPPYWLAGIAVAGAVLAAWFLRTRGKDRPGKG